jgi:hypothetical protein
LSLVGLVVGGAAVACSQPATSRPLPTPALASQADSVPSPPPGPSIAPSPAASPEPAATATPSELTVSGAGAGGVSLRPAPGASERLKILPDGAVLTSLGQQQQAAGRAWVRVRDAAGSEGWVAAEFVVAPVAAQESDRLAFLNYGKRFWEIVVQSDQVDTTLSAALAQTGPGEPVSNLARTGRQAQRRLYDQVVGLAVPDRGKALQESLEALLLSRISVAEQVRAFSDGTAGGRTELDQAARRAEQALIRYTVAYAGLAQELGVDYVRELGPGG